MDLTYGKILREFGWLANFCTMDYFVEDHWNSLPNSWRRHFDECIILLRNSANNKNSSDKSDNSISERRSRTIILTESIIQARRCYFHKTTGPFPLSLIVLKRCVFLCSILRETIQNKHQIEDIFFGSHSISESSKALIRLDEVLPYQLRLKIKAKKEHEIARLYHLLDVLLHRLADFGEGSWANSAEMRLVDVGSGLGHLSRILSILLTLDVATIEGNAEFVKKSLEIDNKFLNCIKNSCIDVLSAVKSDWGPPTRRLAFIEAKSQINNCIEKDENPKILIGLHACGDLSATILRNFVSDPSAKMLVSVGCCYHKLNGGMDKLFRDVYDEEELQNKQRCETGFPMSKRFADLKLSYASRELACFSMKCFQQKLQLSMDSEILFIDVYRAILEWLILGTPPIGDRRNGYSFDSTLRHRGLRGVKNAVRLDFWDYAHQTLHTMPQLQKKDNGMASTVKRLIDQENERVLIVYTLRQIIAPLIETIILEDRRAFLVENGVATNHVVPLFNFEISPRNLVLVSIKLDGT